MTHKEFINATPKQKAIMITDGIEYLAWRMEKMATEMKVLNSWISSMPDFCKEYEEILFDESFKNAEEQFAYSRDNLTSQIILHSQVVTKLHYHIYKSIEHKL